MVGKPSEGPTCESIRVHCVSYTAEPRVSVIPVYGRYSRVCCPCLRVEPLQVLIGVA